MHLISHRIDRDLARTEPPTLVFRAVLHGSAHVQWRHRKVRLDEDGWLVLDGREPCAWRADPETGAEAVEIGVPAEICAAAALAAQTPARPGLVFADHLRSTGDPAGRRLLEIARAQKTHRWPSPQRGALVELVSAAVAEEAELRRRAARIPCVKSETRESLLRRILLAADFIASHHDEPISLAEIARASSLSRFHFVRVFSHVHGETPHAFLLRKRTAVARRHLAVGSACCDAASRAGFGSRSALFRNLRKLSGTAVGTGVAPAATAESCFLSA